MSIMPLLPLAIIRKIGTYLDDANDLINYGKAILETGWLEKNKALELVGLDIIRPEGETHISSLWKELFVRNYSSRLPKPDCFSDLGTALPQIDSMIKEAFEGKIESIQILVGNSLDKALERVLRSSEKARGVILESSLIDFDVNDLFTLRVLLKYGMDLDRKIAGGCTALEVAVEKKRIEKAKILLEAGAKVTSGLLLKAVLNKSIKIVPLLLKKGAIINEVNSEGYTSLSIAIENRDFKMVCLLLQKGADPTLIHPQTLTYLPSFYKDYPESKKIGGLLKIYGVS